MSTEISQKNKGVKHSLFAPRIPSFIPLVEKERPKREVMGLLIEMGMWGYIFALIYKFYFELFLTTLETIREPEFTFWEKIFTIGSPLHDSFINYFINPLLSFHQYDSFNYEPSLFKYFIFFVIGALFGAFLSYAPALNKIIVSHKTGYGLNFGAWIASLSKIQVRTPEDSIRIETHWKWARREGLFFLIATILAGIYIADINPSKLFNKEGIEGAVRLTRGLFCGVPLPGIHTEPTLGFHISNIYYYIEPVFSLFNNTLGTPPSEIYQCKEIQLDYYPKVLGALAESIYIAFMATFISLPISFVLSFFAARNLTRHSWLSRTLYTSIRFYVNVTRSIEPIVWAIIFSVWVQIGPFAGTLALMIHSVSSLVKQFSEIVEGVDNGPIEAMEAVGAGRITTVWFSIVPQIVLPYIAFIIYRWDINVRMATVIGLVGGGGIGTLLIQEQGHGNWHAVGLIAFCIFLVVWAMDFVSAKLREAIN